MAVKKQATCAICGGPNPPERRKLCSDACDKQARRGYVARYSATEKGVATLVKCRKNAQTRRSTPEGKAVIKRGRTKWKARLKEERQQQRQLLPKQKCAICETEFVPKHNQHKTCGDAVCKREFLRRRQAQWFQKLPKAEHPEKTCCFCPTIFVQKTTRQITCGSVECKKAARLGVHAGSVNGAAGR